MSSALVVGTLLLLTFLFCAVAFLFLGLEPSNRDQSLRDAAERWASRQEQDAHPVSRTDWQVYRGNNRHDRRRQELNRRYW